MNAKSEYIEWEIATVKKRLADTKALIKRSKIVDAYTFSSLRVLHETLRQLTQERIK